MDKSEVLFKLKRMFDEPIAAETDSGIGSIIETRQIDRHNYLALVTRTREATIKTDQDYDTFIYMLRYNNSKESNTIINLLNNNLRKFFVDYSDAEKELFLDEVRKYTNMLKGVTLRNRVIVEATILEWVESLV